MLKLHTETARIDHFNPRSLKRKLSFHNLLDIFGSG